MSDDRTNQLLDEVVKLLALDLRERADDQNALILTLDKLGFEGPRVAQLMETTDGNVRKIRHRAKKSNEGASRG